jgi:hypothetical protein
VTNYYPLIARAIAGLGANASGEIRRTLYERARVALVNQLHSVQPPLSESDITRERLALEEAVRKIETESAHLARELSLRAHKELSNADLSSLAEMAERLEKALKRSRQIAPDNQTAIPLSSASPSTEASILGRSPHPPLPSITWIPEQSQRKAITFRTTRRGQLDLDADPPQDPYDPEQSILYTRIRSQLKTIRLIKSVLKSMQLLMIFWINPRVGAK